MNRDVNRALVMAFGPLWECNTGYARLSVRLAIGKLLWDDGRNCVRVSVGSNIGACVMEAIDER